jgi:hypothetical protein
LIVAGGALAGAGTGAAFKGRLSTVIAVVRRARGEALAGLFLAAYAGLAVPVVGLGLATQLLSPRDAVLGLAAVWWPWRRWSAAGCWELIG